MATSKVAGINTVQMTAAGDVYASTCVIQAIVWEGSTSAGNTVVLSCPSTGQVLWRGRTAETNTYCGIAPPKSIKAPNGFTLSQISAGTLVVYLAEA